MTHSANRPAALVLAVSLTVALWATTLSAEGSTAPAAYIPLVVASPSPIVLM